MTAVVIPLKTAKTITDDTPMKFPTIPNLPSFVFALHNSSGNNLDTDKQSERG